MSAVRKVEALETPEGVGLAGPHEEHPVLAKRKRPPEPARAGVPAAACAVLCGLFLVIGLGLGLLLHIKDLRETNPELVTKRSIAAEKLRATWEQDKLDDAAKREIARRKLRSEAQVEVAGHEARSITLLGDALNGREVYLYYTAPGSPLPQLEGRDRTAALPGAPAKPDTSPDVPASGFLDGEPTPALLIEDGVPATWEELAREKKPASSG